MKCQPHFLSYFDDVLVVCRCIQRNSLILFHEPKIFGFNISTQKYVSG